MATKSKVELPKYIASRTQRNIAFCKRKRAFLKKAIELSVSCGQEMLVMIFDKQRNRLIQYSSSDDFNLRNAYEAQKVAKTPENIHMYEKFTNDDFLRLEVTDFRSIRYKKKILYDKEVEYIEEFEEDASADRRLAELKQDSKISSIQQKDGYFSSSDAADDGPSSSEIKKDKPKEGLLAASLKRDMWNEQFYKFRKGATGKAHLFHSLEEDFPRPKAKKIFQIERCKRNASENKSSKSRSDSKDSEVMPMRKRSPESSESSGDFSARDSRPCLKKRFPVQDLLDTRVDLDRCSEEKTEKSKIFKQRLPRRGADLQASCEVPANSFLTPRRLLPQTTARSTCGEKLQLPPTAEIFKSFDFENLSNSDEPESPTFVKSGPKKRVEKQETKQSEAQLAQFDIFSCHELQSVCPSKKSKSTYRQMPFKQVQYPNFNLDGLKPLKAPTLSGVPLVVTQGSEGPSLRLEQPISLSGIEKKKKPVIAQPSFGRGLLQPQGCDPLEAQKNQLINQLISEFASSERDHQVRVTLNSNLGEIRQLLKGQLSEGVSVEQLRGMIYGFCKQRVC